MRGRKRLIEAAAHEFAEMGLDGASTRDIAARANLAQSALPCHFRTKEMLWKAEVRLTMGEDAFSEQCTELLLRLLMPGSQSRGVPR